MRRSPAPTGRPGQPLMGMLDHWHPVYPGPQLANGQAVGVQLADRLICLYRTAAGAAAAVDDVCPHRRLKLSFGTVVGDRIRCRYHGWSFDPCGGGSVPSNPAATPCTEAFDTREDHGYVWVKSKASAPDFPRLNPDGYYHLGNFQNTVNAPFELTVDNYAEIEHSGSVHDTFGYALDRLHEVRVRVEATDDTVRVVNVGPSKKLFGPFAWLLGIRDHDLFHDDWTTHFSPVYNVYDHWWTSPDGGREGMIRWRVYAFILPLDAARTSVVSFVFAKSKFPGPYGGLRLARYLFRQEIAREARADVAILEHLADTRTDLDGMDLGRFDRPLPLVRERINRLYRGERRLALV